MKTKDAFEIVLDKLLEVQDNAIKAERLRHEEERRRHEAERKELKEMINKLLLNKPILIEKEIH